MRIGNLFYFVVLMLWSATLCASGARPVAIGLTAEFQVIGSTSAQAVESGMRLAVEEINAAGGVLGGRRLVMDVRDDHAVPARAKRNLREMARNPDLVAVYTAKFSPVALSLVPLVHELNIPLLATWSAADGVTEHRHDPSYTFRLSMKDDWAIRAMLNELAVKRGYKRLAALLPATAWGRSSAAALSRHAPGEVHIEWYNWGDKSLLAPYERILASRPDGLILVANEREGAILLKTLAALPPGKRVPIVSHWGVTGGNFVELTGTALDAVDFAVVQTFTYADPDTPVRRRVKLKARELLGLDVAGMPSIVGFAHAYDMTHILSRAIDLAGSTDRRAIRDALEQVEGYEGLLGTYARPFTPERHDALNAGNVFLARFRGDGTLERCDGNGMKCAGQEGEGRASALQAR